MFRPWPVLLVAGIILSACGTAPEAPVTEPGAAAPVPVRSAAPATPAGTTDEDGDQSAEDEDGEAAEDEDDRATEIRKPRISLPEPEMPQLAAVPPTAALPGPEGLIGLGREELRTLLGEPGFKRRDPPAELWQYGGNGCFLDLFLYRNESSGGEYRVTHMEARGRTVASVPLKDCYFSLFAEKPE
ncbi:MAG: hypothetical protein MI741_14910 [Rhodospirillales bacterium]|nr:hypothetical protein [Rhodospirillales bacterium]